MWCIFLIYLACLLLDFVASKAMRTILWDLDRNAQEIPFNFDCLRYPPVILFSLLAQNYSLLWKIISFLPLYTSLLRDRAGGRRQKTLLICNPPLPLTQVFTQTSFHSFQHFLPVQLKGVHFKH